MPRQSHYTLLIICEGENTEPLFFRAIRDRILQGQYPVDDITVYIRPEPKIETGAEQNQPIENKDYVHKRKLRKVLPSQTQVPPDIPGVPPLKWVLAAQQELRDGTFDEVWVVFDNDGHPAKEEAFARAADEIGGKRVQVAYSSIAFEYYLLLHFERYYYPFQKSECRIGKAILNCSTGQNHPQDCHGSNCVGGYARKKGYWIESKERRSVFPIVEPLLETGFWNAAWIRHESELKQGAIPFFDRNPYVTTDAIVKRLTGYRGHQYDFVELDHPFTIKNDLQVVFTRNFSLEITNIGKTSIVLPPNSIIVTNLNTGVSQNIGDRNVIHPGHQANIPFANSQAEFAEYKLSFHYNNFHLGLNK